MGNYYTFYEKLVLLAELEHLWKEPDKIVLHFLELGVRKEGTNKKEAEIVVRNQIATLGKIKAIFQKNKHEHPTKD